MDGDPHVTTLDRIRYDFQGAGEYVALRDTDGVEIQTLSVPVSTTFNPGPDAGLTAGRTVEAPRISAASWPPWPERGFADLFLATQRIRAGATLTTVTGAQDPKNLTEMVTFTATVAARAAGGKEPPAGTVQFLVDGKEVGEPVQLDENGQAKWETTDLKPSEYKVTARYIAQEKGIHLNSTSFDEIYVVDWQ